MSAQRPAERRRFPRGAHPSRERAEAVARELEAQEDDGWTFPVEQVGDLFYVAVLDAEGFRVGTFGT